MLARRSTRATTPPGSVVSFLPALLVVFGEPPGIPLAPLRFRLALDVEAAHHCEADHLQPRCAWNARAAGGVVEAARRLK
jgi:hypothetical protein